MCRVGPQFEGVSLWVAAVCPEGIAISTDSARGMKYWLDPRAELGEKVWKCGPDTWVFAAGAFRNIWNPPAWWPDPLDSDWGLQPPFDDLLAAFAAQMASGSYAMDD